MFVFSCIASLCEDVEGSRAIVQYNGVHELLRFLHLALQGGFASPVDDLTTSRVLRYHSCPKSMYLTLIIHRFYDLNCIGQ